MFREVTVPENVRGRLFLHSMPGRKEPIGDFLEALGETGIAAIYCLVSDSEINRKSPGYMALLNGDGLPCPIHRYPIPDYGIPPDSGAFRDCVLRAVNDLKEGRNILIHCAGGIGRTGTMACCVVRALGGAENTVYATGSHPETDDQRAFVDTLELRKE